MNTQQMKDYLASGALDAKLVHIYGEGKCIVLRIRPEGAVCIA